MLSAFGPRDYTSNMVQPTKIHGRPTFLHIRKLEKELIKNAAHIQCDIGGGAHGYLGLIKSAAEYNRIAGTNFIMPAEPPTLVIPNNTTGHESFRLQQNHILEKERYKEAIAVKRALGQMITNAIDNDLISDYIDDDTQQLTGEIHEVLEYLYTYYGKVDRRDLKIAEKEVDNLNYDLTRHPSIIWKAIDDLQRIAKAAKLEYTNEQLVHTGLSIIRDTHDFEKGQDEWHSKPTADKTYRNLKKHFNDAYAKLQLLRGEDMRPAAHHTANAMRITMNENNTTLQEEMLSKVNTIKEDIIGVIQAEKENINPVEHSMNAATTNNTMSKLTTVLEGLERRMAQVE